MSLSNIDKNSIRLRSDKNNERLSKETANRITDEREKACGLMWDEVSLKLHLQYCSRKDKMIGVED